MTATSSADVLEAFRSKFDIHQKTILEVGGIVDENLINDIEIDWTSVDPLYTPLKKYELVSLDKPLVSIKHIKEDITKSLFEKEVFDYIFSCNAFHHIGDLEKAFKNFYKWLKPGGVLYSHFGPIWTAPDGSHIEGLEHEEIIYNFWDNKLIPFWSHLHLSYEEMQKFLLQHYTPEFAKKIADAVYKSKWINRLKFSNYLELVENKHWEVIEISSDKNIDYKPISYMYSVDSKYENDLLKSISLNTNENFHARDILMIIKKVG